jgi:hypothetical protein
MSELSFRLHELPNADFVWVEWRMALCTSSTVRAPGLTDVRAQFWFADIFLHRREQDYWRLAIRLRASEKHDVDGEIVHALRSFGFRFYARLRQLVARGTGIVYVRAAVLRRHCLQPNDGFECGK